MKLRIDHCDTFQDLKSNEPRSVLTKHKEAIVVLVIVVVIVVVVVVDNGDYDVDAHGGTQHARIRMGQSEKFSGNSKISVQLHCNPKISAKFLL